ncbi:MAG: hypothetical protein H6732_07080 [Alphaproteobacteria bacterium]|nr:hypothetical protein [Alphaproteobacteria bacterium]
MVRPGPRVASLVGGPRLLLACVLCASGCLAIPDLLSGADGDASPDDATGDDRDVSADTFVTGDPVWGVGGELALSNGAVAIATSSLQLATRGVSCDVRAQIARVTPIALSVERPDLLQLWRFDVTLDDAASCTWLGPTTFVLGLGPTDAALRPGAARAGLEADRGYALLLGPVDQDPLLVGLAGTAAQLDGTEQPVISTPLPDGVYQLVTLHGLPVDR